MESFILNGCLIYPSVFSYRGSFDSDRPMFSFGVAISESVQRAIPAWVRVGGTEYLGRSVVSVRSLSRVPVFGLSADWHSRVRAVNLHTDHVLSGAEVRVSLKYRITKGGGLKDANMMIPIAIQVLQEPIVPGFEEFLSSQGL
jgi:hypothetical protein